VSSASATTPLLRSAGASGSGNILAAAARSVSQGNLGGYGGNRGLQTSVSCFDEDFLCGIPWIVPSALLAHVCPANTARCSLLFSGVLL